MKRLGEGFSFWELRPGFAWGEPVRAKRSEAAAEVGAVRVELSNGSWGKSLEAEFGGGRRNATAGRKSRPTWTVWLPARSSIVPRSTSERALVAGHQTRWPVQWPFAGPFVVAVSGSFMGSHWRAPSGWYCSAKVESFGWASVISQVVRTCPDGSTIDVSLRLGLFVSTTTRSSGIRGPFFAAFVWS